MTSISYPSRIVSLLGGATETLVRLGVTDKLVGRSHECDYPDDIVQGIPCVSKPKLNPLAPSIEIDEAVRKLSASGEPVYELHDKLLMEELQPIDLLIVQDHCRVCAVTPDNVNQIVQANAKCLKIPQLVLKPETLKDCMDNIQQIADAVGVSERGKLLIETLEERFQRVEQLSARVVGTVKPRVALLEWCQPLMGCGYWLPELIEKAGGCPLHHASATPMLSFKDDLVASKPDVIIFALCGFDIRRATKELTISFSNEQLGQLQQLTNGHVYVVDGNHLINRSGPRVVESSEALAEVIHPSLQGHWGHYGVQTISLKTALENLRGYTVEEQVNGVKNVVKGSNNTRNGTNGTDETHDLSIPTTISTSFPQPASSASDIVELQLRLLREKQIKSAFALNSVANQERWCSPERFQHVMESHATFQRLLNEAPEAVTHYSNSASSTNGSSSVVSVNMAAIPTSKVNAMRLFWTMVPEVPEGKTEPEWRTERVAVA